MAKKEIGGQRIGSGNKMTVETAQHSRSQQNLTTEIATGMTIGTVVPIHNSVVLAGDTREIDISSLVITRPTNGPLLDSFKGEINVFKYDMRLSIGKLHMNLLKKGLTMADIKMMQIEMEAEKIDWSYDPSNQQTSPSSIFRYLGISGLGDTTDATKPKRYFNGTSWFAYWEIIKHYYANKQEELAWVIHTPPLNIPEERLVSISVEGSFTAPIAIPRQGAAPNIKYDMEEDGTMVKTVLAGTTPGDTRKTIFLQLQDKYNANVIREFKIEDIFGRTESYVDGGDYITENTYATNQTWENWWLLNWRFAEQQETYETKPELTSFPLSNLDDMKMDVLADIKSADSFKLTKNSVAPFGLALAGTGKSYSKQFSQEGLAVKTYDSDYFNNWLDTEWIDGDNGINQRTSLQTDDDGRITIDQLLLKQKFYDYLNDIAVSGGTVDDMMEVTYDVKNKTKSEIPEFVGGASFELTFNEVVSNAASEDQPLGTIAGKGNAVNHKGGSIRISNDGTEHAIYMVLASFTPRIRYTQGNRWETQIENYDQWHKPAYDQIGYQDLITDEMAYFDTKVTNTGVITYKSAGKQPAWTQYQTEVNRAFGNFAIPESEGWMINDRSYDWDEQNKRIKDLTTYIDPMKYNGIWSYSALDAMNIWLQVRIKDKAIRKMSNNLQPRTHA